MILDREHHVMRIFVGGTWRAEKAEPFREQALELGKSLATRGHSLMCGPGTGLARHVVDGYRSVREAGGVTFYLPRKELMEAVGEEVGAGADDVVYTEYDYPMRNVYQVGLSEAVIVITGGDGALQEVVAALSDYGLPVAALRASGRVVEAMEALVDVFPAWKRRSLVAENVEDLLTFVESGAPRDS